MALRIALKEKEYRVDYREINGVKGDILCSFWVTPMSPFEIDNLLEKNKMIEWDSPSRKTEKQRFVEYNHIAILVERIKKVIKRWEGIEDESGVAIPCTDENKVVLFEKQPELIQFVLAKADEVTKLIKDERDTEEKN